MSDEESWCQNTESGEEEVQSEVIVVQADV